jgi:acyl carrier protein phosphodiesterase
VQRWTKAACAAQFVANPEMATTELAGELLGEFARGRRRQSIWYGWYNSRTCMRMQQAREEADSSARRTQPEPLECRFCRHLTPQWRDLCEFLPLIVLFVLEPFLV